MSTRNAAAAKASTVVPHAVTVGSYRVGERLGEGGMGEVYHAVDTMLEREVALKVLRPEMSARADVVERFRVEAIALARLHHRHIAAVYSFFQERERHYIAMQYVRGRTLEAVLQQRGALPWREAAAIAIDVLHALEHAHALGVVHRDLKPANLMVDHESRTVVMDFGIARMAERGRQTRAGTLVGTLEYIAPELVRGETADARSDLYSLGCVLYEMVTGSLPFESPSDFALMRAHAEQAPPRPILRNGDLPPALESIILRALEKQPARRYPDARAFLEALTAVAGPAPAAREPATRTEDKPGRAVAPLDVAGTVRRIGAQARTQSHAAWRWLDLPRAGGWPAWKTWLRANLGLASAVGVAASAAVLAVAMGTHQVCCSAPVRPDPRVEQGPAPQPPAATDANSGSAGLNAASLAATTAAAPVTPVPVPPAPPVDPAPGPADLPPLVRSIRVAPVEPAPRTQSQTHTPPHTQTQTHPQTQPPAASGSATPPSAGPSRPQGARPAPERGAAPSSGWYVKR